MAIPPKGITQLDHNGKAAALPETITEVDGMTPGKTIVLHQQGVVCSLPCLEGGNPKGTGRAT